MISAVSAKDLEDAQVIWDYHLMHHQSEPADVGIGLGSHDLGVATFAVKLYHEQLFPMIVFTGATSRTTAARFPRGEAVHYRDHAIELGVPSVAIRIETNATNTGENIALTRDLLAASGTPVKTVLLISKPYMERRAFATCQKVWPEVRAICASQPIGLNEYLASIGDPKLVLDMLVGDFQRVMEYPALGFAIAQDIPDDVETAYRRLISTGYTSRLATT
ncbi:YdcF family protein [Kribbella kalugense]|uniref:Uncharacterized SAM-binding protein YcdF (DUF218 family) n=1 Tax=Kribbella kalugense TaxID=2512221 RepID=A0A4R7ZUG5_9ACTN|nr:YdcF family protein [Kribbella kalugense]TDW21236.1 uncharacterized SAM-binding protein YcdF (DUF218 family) [Kribbella kalugense]